MVATIQKRAGGDESANRQMNDSSRDSWQRLMQVVEKLAITPGSHVADLGARGGVAFEEWAGAIERESGGDRSS